MKKAGMFERSLSRHGRLLWGLGMAGLLGAAAAPAPCRGGSPGIDRRAVGTFVCRSEIPLAEVAPLLAELEQLQIDLVQMLGIPRANEPIELLLFRSKRGYERYLSENLPGLTRRRAMYVKSGGPGRVYTYRSPRLETDVRHECTHGLLHAALPAVPLWLDEGLAEYCEVPREKRAFDNPYLSGLRWSLWIGRVPRLEELEKKDKLENTDREDYRNAWAWVHFLLHGPPEGHEELLGFLSDLRTTTTPRPLSERLRDRMPNLEAKFTAHFNTWQRRPDTGARRVLGSGSFGSGNPDERPITQKPPRLGPGARLAPPIARSQSPGPTDWTLQPPFAGRAR